MVLCLKVYRGGGLRVLHCLLARSLASCLLAWSGGLEEIPIQREKQSLCLPLVVAKPYQAAACESCSLPLLLGTEYAEGIPKLCKLWVQVSQGVKDNGRRGMRCLCKSNLRTPKTRTFICFHVMHACMHPYIRNTYILNTYISPPNEQNCHVLQSLKFLPTGPCYQPPAPASVCHWPLAQAAESHRAGGGAGGGGLQ